MVIGKKIANLVLGLDQFGPGINFHLMGSDTFKTYPGSLFSVLCSIIVLTYGFY